MGGPPISGHTHGGWFTVPFFKSIDGPFQIDGIRIWYDERVRKISLHLDGKVWHDIGSYMEGPNYVERSNIGNVFGFESQGKVNKIKRLGAVSTDYGIHSIMGFERMHLPERDTFRLLEFDSDPVNLDIQFVFNHPVDVETLVASVTCNIDITSATTEKEFKAIGGVFRQTDDPRKVIFYNPMKTDLVYPGGKGQATWTIRMGGVKDRAGALLDGKAIGLPGGVFYKKKSYLRDTTIS